MSGSAPGSKVQTSGEDLAEAVRHKFSALRSLLEDLRRETGIYGPRQFAEAVILIAEGTASSFEEEVADLEARAGSDKDLYELAEAYLAQLRGLHGKIVPYLQPCDISRIPVELLMVLRGLAGFISPEVSLALFPQWRYMYEFSAFRDLVASWLADMEGPAVKRLHGSRPGPLG